ncbi:amylo-alpha-1,6-glucosidase [Micromonospora sp. NBC_01739]|uniref:amylo-alpha-1,6-glucosidase n=1 Tax=Micromonospora sp. NBC_01739 TaxID=2975985 RepID=UPI002E14765E|nr:hypothetical protein OIE53_04455 [Micromonospora sp. NBC_01739]
MSRVRNLRVRPDLLYVASGWSTLVTDVRGRITGVGPQGFFARNTRVLSTERITVDGGEPVPFSTATVQGHAQLSYAELGDGEVLPSRAAYLSVERFVAAGLRTRLTLFSYADRHLDLCLRIGLDADFADTSEAESGRRLQSGAVEARWDRLGQELLLTYRCDGLDRAVAIRVQAQAPIRYADGTLTVEVALAPGSLSRVDLAVEPIFDGQRLPAPPADFKDPDDAAGSARRRLTAELARLTSSNFDVTAAWRCAREDLAGLPLGEAAGPTAPIAGLPIYQEIFGRDTMTASWQAMLAGPTMLADSLRLNAQHFGRRIDDWRDEEPGKPLHEARRGPLSELNLDPFAHYHGDWSTAPDFLIFLGQYYGGAYWYSALRHAAGIYAVTGHPAVAARLAARAVALRRRFHRAFWLPEQGCYAMALGPDRQPVRSVNSNDGHLLATGIVPPRIAPLVADRLLAPDMFSGWGVRTLSAGHPAYNPFSYHRGSVWPVEAGTIGIGLARYGCWEHLHRLAEGMFAASALFAEHRLPEVLSGLPRDEAHPHPGVYPSACSPQAWSASAVIALIQALLALRPAAPLRTIFVDPHLPPWLPDLVLEGVRLGGYTVDLIVRRRRGGRTSVRTRGDRIAVVRRPTRRALATGRRRR